MLAIQSNWHGSTSWHLMAFQSRLHRVPYDHVISLESAAFANRSHNRMFILRQTPSRLITSDVWLSVLLFSQTLCPFGVKLPVEVVEIEAHSARIRSCPCEFKLSRKPFTKSCTCCLQLLELKHWNLVLILFVGILGLDLAFPALHCIHNFTHTKNLERAFLFLSALYMCISLLLHLAQVLIPFLATKPSHLSCTLAHSCCHFPAFPDFPQVCLSPLLSDSNCNLFLCNSELQDLSVSFSRIVVTVYWYLLKCIAFATMNQISTVGYIWSEGCTVRRLAPQPIALTQKRNRKLGSFYELCPYLWHSQAGGPSIFSVLSQIAPFWAVSLSPIPSLCGFPFACLHLAHHHFTHFTLLPCKCAAASLLVAPRNCHTTTDRSTLKYIEWDREIWNSRSHKHMSIRGITDNEVVISLFRTTSTWKPDAKSRLLPGVTKIWPYFIAEMWMGTMLEKGHTLVPWILLAAHAYIFLLLPEASNMIMESDGIPTTHIYELAAPSSVKLRIEVTWESRVRWCKGKYGSPADKQSILFAKQTSKYHEYTFFNTIKHHMHEICQPFALQSRRQVLGSLAPEPFYAGHEDIQHRRKQQTALSLKDLSIPDKTETAKCPQNEHFLDSKLLFVFPAIKDRVNSGSSKTLTFSSICFFNGFRVKREERQSFAFCNQLSETMWEHFIKKGTRKTCEMKGWMWGKFKAPSLKTKGKRHINADGVCGFFAKSTKSIGPEKNSKPLHPKSLVLHVVEERAFPTQMPLPSNGHGQLKREFIKQLGKFNEEPSIHLHLIGKKMKKSPLTGRWWGRDHPEGIVNTRLAFGGGGTSFEQVENM